MRVVESRDDVQRLAALVCDPARTRPLVAVTCQAYRTAPWVDCERLQRQLGDIADVWGVFRPQLAGS